MPLTAPLLAPDLYERIYERFGNSGGVYVVRATTEHGVWDSINRVLGTDHTGTLYIGKADAFVSRVVHLKKCVHEDYRTGGHPFTHRYDHHGTLRERFPSKRLVVELYGDPEPLRAEKEMLTSYFLGFGEEPPFNKIG